MFSAIVIVPSGFINPVIFKNASSVQTDSARATSPAKLADPVAFNSILGLQLCRRLAHGLTGLSDKSYGVLSPQVRPSWNVAAGDISRIVVQFADVIAKPSNQHH